MSTGRRWIRTASTRRQTQVIRGRRSCGGLPPVMSVEASYPMLRGTLRDHATQRRRSFVRFFACERDLSHDLPDTLLPDPVAAGAEPLLIVGAMAGG